MQELMTKPNSNHCRQCNSEPKKSTKRAHTKLRCLTCTYPVSNSSKSCNKHPNAGYSEVILPETTMHFKCGNCGISPDKEQSS